MKNCIFCKHREIIDSKPKCTSKNGLHPQVAKNRMKYSSDIGCSGYRENDWAKIFEKIGNGINTALNLLK